MHTPVHTPAHTPAHTPKHPIGIKAPRSLQPYRPQRELTLSIRWPVQDSLSGSIKVEMGGGGPPSEAAAAAAVLPCHS